METKLLEEIIKQASFGYAYHKSVIDETNVEDYIFLDINPSFAIMTGSKREDIIGKKVSEVLSLKKGYFNWPEYYSKVALTGERQEFTQYVEPLGRWFKITVFSPEKKHFVTIIKELISEIERINTLEKQKREIEELTNDLEIIFNSTQDAMFIVEVVNGEFRYIRNNKTHQVLTGLSLSDFKGKTPVELFGEEIGESLINNYQRCIEARKPIAYEDILPFPKGQRIWLTTLTPVFEGEKIKYIVGSKKDITEQKIIEMEKEYLLQRLQAMFNEHTALMFLIEPKTGQIVDVNPAGCAFYGYSREEILNMHIWDINMLPRDEIERLLKLTAQEKQKYFTFPHRLKNGEIRLVDVYSCPITYGQEKLLFSIFFDVTEKEQYKQELYREKELLRTTLFSIGDGVVTTDSAGRITALNKAAEEISGWSHKEAQGRLFTEVFKLISEETGEEIENPVAKVLKSGKIIGLANHTALITKAGFPIPIADSAAPIKDEQGQIYGVVMVFRDITKEKEQQEQILYLSYHDSLTGLYNRRFMEEEIKRLDTPRQLPLAIIMGDVNGLKLTNDVFGHEAGDKLLQKVAQIIKENCRREDIIARWGGDEFLIILPQTTAKTAEEIINRINRSCAEKSDRILQLSIALGCAVKTKREENFRQILKDAEEFMYHQKLLQGKSYRNTIINTLLATLAEKSMETEEHAERLKNCSLALGKALKLSTIELDDLALLAVLHDIGKVCIRESVLQKPGSLTAEEWEEMKKHPEIGYRIAQNTPELVVVAEYILSHHERWDGQGYPRGLKGEEIPLLCRILAVADAFDAMTSNRTYRKAMSKEEAIAEIQKNAGTQFDPKIVEVFLSLQELCFE